MASSISKRIEVILGSRPLAIAIKNSIESGLMSPFVHFAGGSNEWAVFKSSLDVAIRDIETHPLGLLFKRLIEFGPHNPDDPKAPRSDGKTILSDPECEKCVEFIYSHMVNRFKGELAELLAVKPVVKLVQQLQNAGELPSNVNVYFGDTVHEKRKRIKATSEPNVTWSGFAKGADGLITRAMDGKRLTICGVVEVKSMYRSRARLESQLGYHVSRMAGGLRLDGREWNAESLQIGTLRNTSHQSHLVSIMVIPSRWKLDRNWSWEQNEHKRVMHFPQPTKPPEDDLIEKVKPNCWRIKLAWSEEALNQAAYEMTYWYMSKVGTAVYSRKPLPKGWEGMTSEEAGYNAIKMMLYYIPLRIKYFHRPGFTRKQLRRYRQRIDRKATRLYNVYCFGYPLGSDSKEMLWPEDFDKEENKAS